LATTTQPTNEITEPIASYVVQCLSQGKRQDEIIQDLIGQGWTQEQATQTVHQIDVLFREARIGAYKKKMLYGLFWALGGIVVTVWTYSAASSGGTYFVAWGAILWGCIDIVRGFVGYCKYR
jgi:hypothetical protein